MKKISLDSNSDLVSESEKAIAERVRSGRTLAVSWMGIERKSSGRVSDYLSRHGYHQDEIALILTSLHDDDYLDDERLARRILRSRQGRQAESRLALFQRMIRLGLDENAIENVLSADEPDDDQTAKILLEQRYARAITDLISDKNQGDSKAFGRQRYELAAKAARFLASRGFSQATICKALAQVGLTIDSFD